MSTPSGAPPSAPRRTLRIVAGSVMAAPVLLLVILVTAIKPENGTDSPDTVFLAVVVAIAIVVTLVILTVGYRVPAIAPTTPTDQAQRQAATAFQTTFFLRLALSEAVAIVGYGMAVVATSGAVWIYVVAMVVGEALLLWHAWPGDALLARVQQRLNRDGASVDVLRAIGA